MTRLIIIRGYPGSGKTSVGKRLADMSVGKFIDHNAILTFIAGIAGNDQGIYKDIADLELAITRKLLQEETNVIVARGFSDPVNFSSYKNVALELDAEVVVIRLEVDKATLSKRVSSEERLGEFNPTVTVSALDKWVVSNPIIDYPSEIIINNTRPLDSVVEEIASAIKPVT